jgi:hypothetical protein
MNIMAHKFLVIALSALFVTVPVFGMAEKIKQGEVVYYKIKKGDTLWHITGRFFEDPFKWPQLWKRNPYIKNPHLIFPGDVLKITPEGIEVVRRIKRKEIRLPLVKLHPPTPPTPEAEEEVIMPLRVEEVPEAPPPPPPVRKVVLNLMARNGFITKEELEESGVIVSSKEKRHNLHSGDEVFLSFKDPGTVFKGDRFTIFTIIEEVIHPVTKEPVGNLVKNLGSLEITDVGEAIEATIDTSYEEIQKGAKLRRFEEPVKGVEVVEAKKGVAGVILASLYGTKLMSESDIVFIDKGESDGLTEGNILEIKRERAPVEDPYNKNKVLTFPLEELGTLILIDVKEDVSTAIILDNLQAINSGDIVKTPGFVE